MADQRFNYGNHSDKGMVYDHNEDSFASFSVPIGDCFLVCDGVGGNAGGEVASQLAVETIKRFLESSAKKADPQKTISAALEFANKTIRRKRLEVPELSDAATTCLLLLLESADNSRAWVAHLGDSRAYLLRDNSVTKLTRDHSRVMEMVDRGIITEEEARTHPQKNIITKSLGSSSVLRPDINSFQIRKNDRILLCSDGVSDMVRDEELLQCSKETSSIEELPRKLVDLANERGGPDNSTAIAIEILEDADSPVQATQPGIRKITALPPLKWIALSFFLGVILTLLFGFFYLRHSAGGSGNTSDVRALSHSVHSQGSATRKADAVFFAKDWPEIALFCIEMGFGLGASYEDGMTMVCTDCNPRISKVYDYITESIPYRWSVTSEKGPVLFQDSSFAIQLQSERGSVTHLNCRKNNGDITIEINYLGPWF